MRIGLTGGIGSGKSAVASVLEELGAFVIDTDKIAREVVSPNSDGFMEIARAWPQVVRNNALDRAALAEIVFADPAARERLNAILHPHIRRRAQELQSHARPGQLVVHVVPLLFETGYDRLIDRSVVVTSPEHQRVARIVERDRIDETRVRARMNAQIDPESARQLADYVIVNDGDLERLRERTRELYERLTAEDQAAPSART